MKKLALVLFFLPLVSGCLPLSVGAGAVPLGVLYTNATGALSATAAGVGSKEGRACASGILGLVSTGDASVAAAARAGGIQRIATVSYEFSNILGAIYMKTCVVVTGD